MVNINNIQSSIKNILQRSDLTNNITIYRYSLVENSDFEEVLSKTGEDIVQGLYITYASYRKRNDRYGRYNGSDLVFYFPYDTVINKDDKILVNGILYEISYFMPIAELNNQSPVLKVFATAYRNV